MKLTKLEPVSIKFYYSVAYIYVEMAFVNYPTDWDGLYMEILDNPNEFTVFKEAYFYPFKPVSSVAYDKNDNVILLDYDGEPLYGGTAELPDEPNFISAFKIQMESKRNNLDEKGDKRYLFYAPYANVNGTRHVGGIRKHIIEPNGETYTFIDMGNLDDIRDGAVLSDNIATINYDGELGAVFWTEK